MNLEATLLRSFTDWRIGDAERTGGSFDPKPGQVLAAYLALDPAGSPVFSPGWYAEAHGIAASGKNAARAALQSYLKAGVPAGHDPNEWFSESFYRSNYPDVASGIAAGAWRCGFQHYLLKGHAEQRSPAADFNEFGYLGQNPDILQAVAEGAFPSGLFHFLKIGRAEKRLSAAAALPPPLQLPILQPHSSVQPSTSFAEELYLGTNGDVGPDGEAGRGMRHWLDSGLREDLAGTRRRLDGWVESVYRNNNPDLSPFIGTPVHPSGYAHYLMHGAAENRAWAGSLNEAAEKTILADALQTRSALPPGMEGSDLPTISIVVPVFNPDPAAFRACIDSVRTQTYPHWQLCLADDSSTLPHVAEIIREAASADRRVTPVFCLDNGGISAASNAALAAATGAFVALLDHDDVLAPDALLHLAEAFLSGPDVDLVYTDEAKLDEHGTPMGLNPKPGWSPDLLLATMYIGHLTAYRRDLMDRVGGFRSAFDGTQDYDLALRMSEVARRVVHVPKPLYFWRMSPVSTAGSLGSKPGVLAKQARALESAMIRRNQAGRVRPGHLPGHWLVTLDPPADLPLVSIVIPSAGPSATVGGRRIDLLSNNLQVLMEKETYPNLEVLIVHNRDLRPETYALLANFPRLRLVRTHAAPFSFSDNVNLGVREAAGDYVFLLNDDMQAESPGLIQRMFARMYEGVGAVGGKLLFANGTLQHAGIVWASEGPTHAMIGEHRLATGPAERLHDVHDVFAATAACLFMRRSTFLEVGGLSPALPINYNDVEFCIRLRKAGLRIVLNPEAVLYHFESLSKSGTHFWELQRLLLEHPGIADPFWNPAFSSRSPFYELQDGAPDTARSYRSWLIDRIARRQAGLTASRATRFSFIMSVFENRRDQMEVLASTVLNQTYANFEWVITDDGSSKAETLAWLDAIAADERVTVVRLPENQGIMAGYGAAFRAATGDYVIPIDADDFLTLDCLHVLATTIEATSQPDVVYSDEDKGNEAGEVHSPLLKPDWDPVLLSNICYVCHICAIKRATAADVGAYTDLKATWTHDWDTLLRVKRAGGRVEHVPEVLYSWRIHQGSTASVETGTKPQARESQRHVLQQDLDLTGAASSFELVTNELEPHGNCWRLKPRAAALPACALVVVASPQPGQTARFLGMLATLPRPAGTPLLLVGAGDTAQALASVLPEVAAAFWPGGLPTRFSSFAEAAQACRAQGRIAVVLDAAVDTLGRDFLPEGLGMFAAAERVGAVGGQVVQPDGVLAWRGGYAGFAGFIGSPEFGGAVVGGGYYGLGLFQRLCDGVPSVTFFAEPALLAEAARRAGDTASLRVLAGHVATEARRAGQRVVFTPFVSTTLSAPAAIWPVAPDGAAEVFAAGPVFHSPAFGTSTETGYRLR